MEKIIPYTLIAVALYYVMINSNIVDNTSVQSGPVILNNVYTSITYELVSNAYKSPGIRY